MSLPGHTWFGAAIIALTAVAAPDVRVTPQLADGHVFASFAAPAAYSADVEEAVRTGLAITLTFTVDLRRGSTLWFDHTLATTTVATSIKFDNLTHIYQVSKLNEGRVTWSEQTDREDQMQAWATAFDRVLVSPGDGLEANADYYLRVRVRASPHRTFFLWPWGRDDASGRADFTFIR